MDPVVPATPFASLSLLRAPMIKSPTLFVPSVLANRPTLAGAGLSLPVAVCVHLSGAVLAKFTLLVRQSVMDLAVVHVNLLDPRPILVTPSLMPPLLDPYRLRSPLKLSPPVVLVRLHVLATVRVIVPCILVEN